MTVFHGKEGFIRMAGKRLFTRKLLRLIFPLALVASFVSNSYGEAGKITYGASFSGGFTEQGRNYFTRWAILPRVGLPLHKYWDLEFEGNFSYYDTSEVKKLYVLGFNGNILFRPIRWGRACFFLLAGAGLGYDNSTDGNHHTWDVGDTHVAGTLQGGLGVDYSIAKGWGIRGEYRFNHVSDPFRPDPGINTHNFMLGFTF